MMKDCKHKHFQELCCVCWYKVSKGIQVKDTPSIISKSNELELQYIALKLAESALDHRLKRQQKKCH